MNITQDFKERALQGIKEKELAAKKTKGKKSSSKKKKSTTKK